MEKFIQTIENLPVSKTGIEALANTIAENITSKEVDPLNAYVAIKAMSELCKVLEKNDQIKQTVIDAVDGGADVYGAKVIKKTAATYDYTCSLAWCNLDSEIAKLTEQRKQIETALKNASELTPFIDPDDCARITSCPKETEKVTISVTLKK